MIGLLILQRKFFFTDDSDDARQTIVLIECGKCFRYRVVMVLTDYSCVYSGRSRAKRIDSRIPSSLRDASRKNDDGIHVRERRGDRRVLKFVCRYVSCLHGRDRAARGGDEPVLELGYLRLKGRLGAGFRRDLSKER